MIRVGTSGWNYDHWKGPFYPDDLSQDEWLSYYAERFSSVEINNSFYSLPDTSTMERWRDTPEGDFTFAIKASRYLTHMKKLREAPESLERFLARADVLGERLGPVLFQLPPRWNVNPHRLRSFTGRLESSRRYVFEFRDTSWFADEIYEALGESNCAFCIYQLDEVDSPIEVTADFVYVRLHGPNGPYEGSYEEEALKTWAERLRNWESEGLDAYCYFDNDQNGYAAANARDLVNLVSS